MGIRVVAIYFLISRGDKICPIEVKSGNYRVQHEGIDSRRLAYWKKALIDRGLFTDRVSVSKAAKLQESADKNPEEPKLLVNIMSESAHPSILPSALESFIYIQSNDRNRLVIPDNFNPHTLAKS